MSFKKKKSNAIFYYNYVCRERQCQCTYTTMIVSACLTLINYIFNVRNCPTEIVIYFDYNHQTRTDCSFYYKSIVKTKAI